MAPSADARAPWEIDGRQWHTRDRIARNGKPARWDGRILELIVEKVDELVVAESNSDAGRDPGLASPDWSQRNTVRIDGRDKTRISLPFFHATTSSEWVVTLRFFVPKSTFRPSSLEKQLGLVPFHESTTPILCDQPRVRIESLGPYQQITIVGHAVEELDTAGFEGFLETAVKAYLNIAKTDAVTI